MRILAIAGSPRRGENTDLLLNHLVQGASSKGAQVSQVVVSSLDLSGCGFCRSCDETGECIVMDDMQAVYPTLYQADHIAVASPVHFRGVSAQLKALIDRCQAVWGAKHLLRKPRPAGEKQRLGVFLCAATDSSGANFSAAVDEVKAFFGVLDVTYYGEVLFPGGAGGEVADNPDYLGRAYALGEELAQARF